VEVDRKKSMEEAILRIVDEKLSILGEHGKHLTYFYLEKRGIKQCEIPRRMEEFLSVLEETYSISATVILGKLIVKGLEELAEAEELKHVLEIFKSRRET